MRADEPANEGYTIVGRSDPIPVEAPSERTMAVLPAQQAPAQGLGIPDQPVSDHHRRHPSRRLQFGEEARSNDATDESVPGADLDVCAVVVVCSVKPSSDMAGPAATSNMPLLVLVAGNVIHPYLVEERAGLSCAVRTRSVDTSARLARNRHQARGSETPPL